MKKQAQLILRDTGTSFKIFDEEGIELLEAGKDIFTDSDFSSLVDEFKRNREVEVVSMILTDRATMFADMIKKDLNEQDSDVIRPAEYHRMSMEIDREEEFGYMLDNEIYSMMGIPSKYFDNYKPQKQEELK